MAVGLAQVQRLWARRQGSPPLQLQQREGQRQGQAPQHRLTAAPPPPPPCPPQGGSPLPPFPEMKNPPREKVQLCLRGGTHPPLICPLRAKRVRMRVLVRERPGWKATPPTQNPHPALKARLAQMSHPHTHYCRSYCQTTLWRAAPMYYRPVVWVVFSTPN